MKPILSCRAQSVQPFRVMDMLAQATKLEIAGESIIHLEAGQPHGPPPRKAVEAAQNILASDKIGYTESLGLLSLRQRIAQYYADTYSLTIDPARIIITGGSSSAFILTFLIAFNAGDRVAIGIPGYPAYKNILSSLDITPVEVTTSAANRWAMTPDDIDRLCDEGEGLNGVLIASPANPTGMMYTPQQLAALCDKATARGLWFISDEIYHGLNFTQPIATALSTNPDAVVINSFSKYYCMTGWRIGWMVVPETMAKTAENLAQSLFICAPTLSQHAAIAAFDATEELDQRKSDYAANLSYLCDALPSIGLSEFTPADGGFYLYLDVTRFTNDSHEFTQRMLREIGVGMTAGEDFDQGRGAGYARMSFAGEKTQLEEAVKRLKNWLPS